MIGSILHSSSKNASSASVVVRSLAATASSSTNFINLAARAFHSDSCQLHEEQQQQQQQQQQKQTTTRYTDVKLPDEFSVDQFLEQEEQDRANKDYDKDYTFKASPTVAQATKSRYMVNPYKFDRRLQPVWDYNKMKAFNEARYPAIESEPVIPPRRKYDSLDEFRVKNVTDIKGKHEFTHGVKSEEMLQAGVIPDMETDLVARIFGWQNATPHELHKRNIQHAISRFQSKPGDTGTPAVQIAIMTEKIKNITAHLQAHHKDQSTQRRMQMLINRRKKMMDYLKRKDGTKYYQVIKALDLRINL